MISFIWVALGGGLGAMLRYGLSRISWLEGALPWATLLANALACMLLGYWAAQDWQDSRRLLWMTGFCGGLSTFSTFSHEKLRLLQSGDVSGFALYLVLSVLVGVSAVYIGLQIGAK